MNKTIIRKQNLRKTLIVEGGQTVELETVSEYIKPYQQGEVEIKAVVMEGGLLFLKGIIKIGKKAAGTEAFLRQKVLLVGENSRAVVVPELEIETDDVRASHAATVGRIDEEEVFYLMSRGLTRDEAEATIIKAFLSP